MTTRPRIYMDSCCLIEVAKGSDPANPEGDRAQDVWATQKLLEAAESGEVDVFMSTLAIVECRHSGDASQVAEETKRLFRSVLESGEIITLVEPEYFLVQRGRDLAWEHGINLGAIDAVHVASALEIDCDEFLTYEFRTKLQRAKEKIEALKLSVVRPSQTAHLPEHYRQESLEPELEESLRDPEQSPL